MCRNRVRQEDEMERTPTSRREFFRLVAGTSTALAGVWTAAVTQAQPLRPTPSCPDAPQPTARQTEGPYFKPESPRRASLLEPGISGVKIVVAGVVLSTNCQPVPRALIDVWHRSEERRVGKECRSRRAPYHEKKKEEMMSNVILTNSQTF